MINQQMEEDQNRLNQYLDDHYGREPQDNVNQMYDEYISKSDNGIMEKLDSVM